MKLTTWITRQTVRTLRFLRDGLWRDASGASRAGQLGRGTVKRIVLAVRCFERERLDSMASALTYRTLFSAVPLLAVVFAVARGFGLDRYIEQSIRNELLDAVLPTLSRLHGFWQNRSNRSARILAVAAY